MPEAFRPAARFAATFARSPAATFASGWSPSPEAAWPAGLRRVLPTGLQRFQRRAAGPAAAGTEPAAGARRAALRQFGAVFAHAATELLVRGRALARRSEEHT